MLESVTGQGGQDPEGKEGGSWKVRLAVSVARYKGTKLKDINLPYLSYAVHLSPSSLSRRFRLEAGSSIPELRARRQLVEALRYLEMTDLDIKRLSVFLGCSRQTLYRRVKAATGYSSSEYRKHYWEERHRLSEQRKKETVGQKMRHKSKI